MTNVPKNFLNGLTLDQFMGWAPYPDIPESGSDYDSEHEDSVPTVTEDGEIIRGFLQISSSVDLPYPLPDEHLHVYLDRLGKADPKLRDIIYGPDGTPRSFLVREGRLVSFKGNYSAWYREFQRRRARELERQSELDCELEGERQQIKRERERERQLERERRQLEREREREHRRQMRLPSYGASPHLLGRSRRQARGLAPAKMAIPPSGGDDDDDEWEDVPHICSTRAPREERPILPEEYYDLLQRRTPMKLRLPLPDEDPSGYITMALRTDINLRETICREDGTLRSWSEARDVPATCTYPFHVHTPSSERTGSPEPGDQHGPAVQDDRRDPSPSPERACSLEAGDQCGSDGQEKPPRPEKAPSSEPTDDQCIPVITENVSLPAGMSHPDTWKSYLDAIIEFQLRRDGVTPESYEARFEALQKQFRKKWLAASRIRADKLIQENAAIRRAEARNDKLKFFVSEPHIPRPARHTAFPYFHKPTAEHFHRRPAPPSSHSETTNHQGSTPLRRSHLDRFPSPSLYATTSLTDLTVLGPANFTHVRCPFSSCHALHTDSLVLSVAGLALGIPSAPTVNYTSAGAIHLGPSNPHNLSFSIPHDHDPYHAPEQAQLRAAMAAIRLAARYCRDGGHLGKGSSQRVHHVVIKTDSAYIVEALLGSADGARGGPMHWLWHYAGVQVDFWLVGPSENQAAIRLAAKHLKPSWTDGDDDDDGDEFENKYEALRRYTHHWYIPLKTWHRVLMGTIEHESAWRKEIVQELTAEKE
ncbi:hypothetical protein CkaCkLH20_06312 [Colletotrichum karsti]|uniref:RNase H type-1 domain-containing protein n=1 Tax=Colletotrichum karsti TaxID=1095194 RepID=A0A9P6I5G1_9PEZI|nr:uncharacterized protein CkaCkLH20_06312 [Colletotrichum karsti]KAF9876369.1 hypothetical protein CkaCkLH20_06312 [Colletotrichum karsti]